MTVIYGVDTTLPITPLAVRDAIVSCFSLAHFQDSNLGDPSLTTHYCTSLIRKFCTDNHDDFDNPTKDSLLRLVESLQVFSKNFRDPTLVAKHANEIKILLDLLP